MTHSYVCHDSFICVSRLIHTCALILSSLMCASFIYVSRLIHMTHAYMCHESFIYVSQLIHMCALTPSCGTHVCVCGIHVCVCGIHVCVCGIHVCVWHSCVCVWHSCVCVWHSCVCVWHSYVCVWHSPPAPMNHVKYLRAGPAEMPFRNWYTSNTNHFHLTDSVRWKSKTQMG